MAASLTRGQMEGHSETTGCLGVVEELNTQRWTGADEKGFRVVVAQRHGLEGGWCPGCGIFASRYCVVTQAERKKMAREQQG